MWSHVAKAAVMLTVAVVAASNILSHRRSRARQQQQQQQSERAQERRNHPHPSRTKKGSQNSRSRSSDATPLGRRFRHNGRATVSAERSLLSERTPEALESKCTPLDNAAASSLTLRQAASDVYVVCRVHSDSAEQNVRSCLLNAGLGVPEQRMLFCEKHEGKVALVRAIAPSVHMEHEPEVALELARFIECVVLVGCSDEVVAEAARRTKSKHAGSLERAGTFAEWLAMNTGVAGG